MHFKSYRENRKNANQLKSTMVLALYLPIKLLLLWLFFSCGFKLLFNIIPDVEGSVLG